MTDASRPTAKLPTSLVGLAIGALVFALLGLLGSCFGLLGSAMQTQNLENFRAMGAGTDPAASTILDPMIALQERIFLPTVVAQVVSVIAASCLLLAGLLVLVRQRNTPTFGPAMLAAAAFFSVLATAAELWVQHLSMNAMESMMAGMGGADPAFGASLSPVMGLGMAFSYGCAGGWLLAKVGFIVWAATELRRPEHAACFQNAPVIGSRGE